MCGIQICDYFFIKKQRVKLSDLYRPSPEGIYYFVRGINPRAFCAWAVGWASQLPGFVATVNPDVKVPKASMHMYYLAFPLGLVISFVVYYGLCTVFPPRGAGDFDDVDYYQTFTAGEAAKLNVALLEESEEVKVVGDGTSTPTEDHLGEKTAEGRVVGV